jgi:hypothetical protein
MEDIDPSVRPSIDRIVGHQVVVVQKCVCDDDDGGGGEKEEVHPSPAIDTTMHIHVHQGRKEEESRTKKLLLHL